MGGPARATVGSLGGGTRTARRRWATCPSRGRPMSRGAPAAGTNRPRGAPQAAQACARRASHGRPFLRMPGVACGPGLFTAEDAECAEVLVMKGARRARRLHHAGERAVGRRWGLPTMEIVRDEYVTSLRSPRSPRLMNRPGWGASRVPASAAPSPRQRQKKYELDSVSASRAGLAAATFWGSKRRPDSDCPASSRHHGYTISTRPGPSGRRLPRAGRFSYSVGEPQRLMRDCPRNSNGHAESS